MKKAIVLLLIAALLLNLSPVPHEENGAVTIQPMGRFQYAREDGSFAFYFVAGCLPWKSCAINEPTDWWIGLYE